MATTADLEQRARDFAIRAHDAIGQKRKYTGESYWKHCCEVAEIVRSVPHTPEMIAAAWLHDTVEDTGITLDTIREEFGPVVAALVESLTDVNKPSDGNRAARKAIDRAHTAAASPAAKTVKIADLISNSSTIVPLDPGFARIYVREKRLLLDTALREGDPTLWARADEIVREAWVTLGMREP